MNKINDKRKPAYDIIGDIHGCASALEALLVDLGYREHGLVFRHPGGRKVVFLGDYIDGGPEIRRSLQIVRGMTDAGQALAILGNHEVNALRYHTRGLDGKWLRGHWGALKKQHLATLDQLADPAPSEWREWMHWFAGLPLWLDLGDMRAVHACWAPGSIAALDGHGRIEGTWLARHSNKNTLAYEHISRLVNGLEARLPNGEFFVTHEGSRRNNFRIKWWESLAGKSCRDAVFPANPSISDSPIQIPDHEPPYPLDAPPVFFGHYAMIAEKVIPLRSNVACVDCGAGKGGCIGAYSWDGELVLSPSKVWLSPPTEHPGLAPVACMSAESKDCDE